MIEIPLRNRKGEAIAMALLDDTDAHLAALAWHLDASGYAVRLGPRIDGRQCGYRLHREVLGLAPGDERQADHVNGNRLDCRRSNLRIVTPGENMHNVRSRGGTSRHRGVYRRPSGRWAAQVRSGGRSFVLGTFDTEAEAAEAARRGRSMLLPLANEERSCA